MSKDNDRLITEISQVLTIREREVLAVNQLGINGYISMTEELEQFIFKTRAILEEGEDDSA